jgi:hypothetical protein
MGEYSPNLVTLIAGQNRLPVPKTSLWHFYLGCRKSRKILFTTITRGPLAMNPKGQGPYSETRRNLLGASPVWPKMWIIFWKKI